MVTPILLAGFNAPALEDDGVIGEQAESAAVLSPASSASWNRATVAATAAESPRWACARAGAGAATTSATAAETKLLRIGVPIILILALS